MGDAIVRVLLFTALAGLAGVIGGQDSEVDASTTDVVFEMATWDPVTVRRAARRLQIRTDAGHRFERIVDARTIEFAARRAGSGMPTRSSSVGAKSIVRVIWTCC